MTGAVVGNGVGCLAGSQNGATAGGHGGSFRWVHGEMDRILDAAMPYMHQSCESMIADYGEDEDMVAEIVRLMAAVALFNREINVEEAVPEQAARATQKAACDTDPDTLFAGAVDDAVKDALD